MKFETILTRRWYLPMYILIVNEDPLGRSLAGVLIQRGHEVAHLDEDPEYCEMVATELGCLVVQGETTNVRVLQEAGIAHADVPEESPLIGQQLSALWEHRIRRRPIWQQHLILVLFSSQCRG